MTPSVLDDAFAHHIWATIVLLDACSELPPDQLSATVPGTFGPIIDTLRHLVEADAWYLSIIEGDTSLQIDEGSLGIAELRAVMERDGEAWSRVLAAGREPSETVTDIDEAEGIRLDAPLSVWLSQATHHGTDHRSQVCTALTLFGVEPPAIDVWDFGQQDGRVVETEGS